MRKTQMRKTLAIIAFAAALAAPLAAQAHRAWIMPSATVLSGTDAWVGVDAAMSNGVFFADHAAMRLDGLVITAPDGSTVAPENMMRGRYRSTFDLHLTQVGTYKIANVMSGVNASYMQGGERKRWRGTAEQLATAIPADATEVETSRSFSRIETFVTLGQPSESVFQGVTEGLSLVPVTHPADLVVGEPATFRLLNNGQPAAGVEVTVAREGARYRDNPEEVTVTTGADGAFTVTWADAGMHWLNASVRSPAEGDQLATNAQYVAVVEVLP
jgi:uncharacterized GH25 family protein